MSDSTGIETGSGGTIATGAGIKTYRILTLRWGLALEAKGLMVRRGQTIYSIVKKEFGFKGSKVKVLAQLDAWIEMNLPLHNAPDLKDG